MKTIYKKAYGALKTEDEMRYDYSIADYPFSKATYDYFVSLNKSIQPPNKTKAPSNSVDMYGRIKPSEEIAQLGAALRDLFDK